VASRYAGYRVDKADPLEFLAQTPPETASVVWTLDYAWDDAEWLARRAARQSLTAPMGATDDVFWERLELLRCFARCANEDATA
jgi:hypothetical protein